MKTKENAIPNLANLRIELVKQAANSTAVHAELRIGKGDFAVDGVVFEVGLKEATLSLDLSGYEIQMGERFGDPLIDNETRGSSTQENVVTKESGHRGGVLASASAGRDGANSTSIDVEATAARSNKSVTIDRTERKTTHHVVRANPNDNWTIRNRNSEEPLNATYLKGDELCLLEPVAGANALSATAGLLVRQRDLYIEVVKNPGFMSRLKGDMGRTKKKLMNILVAKSLQKNATPEEEYTGTILLSKCERSHEDDSTS